MTTTAMQPHVYQSPVGWDTAPEDVLPGCLYTEKIDGEHVPCYGTPGRARDGQPHLVKKPSLDISDRWYPR